MRLETRHNRLVSPVPSHREPTNLACDLPALGTRRGILGDRASLPEQR